MSRKKNLKELHCRVEHITADKLKSWSDELGMSVGEMIDKQVEWYEEDCNYPDAELEKMTISDQLSTQH